MIETNVIVRLKTSFWSDKKGVYQKRAITVLRRKSQLDSYDWISDEVDMIGAEDIIKSIVNLNNSQDGVYRLIICDESTDWETGMVYDYNFKLIPYEES